MMKEDTLCHPLASTSICTHKCMHTHTIFNKIKLCYKIVCHIMVAGDASAYRISW